MPEPASADGAGFRHAETSGAARSAHSSRTVSDMESVRERLRGALPAAVKARDTVAVAALRSALAAIDNAEAAHITTPLGPARGADSAPLPDPTEPAGPASSPESGPPLGERGRDGNAGFAGAVAGLGAGEVERRSLSEVEMEELIRREVADRERAARTYAAAGRREPAERLRAEAEVLSAILGGPGPPPG
jgi:uncharacterized protein YqeY